MLALLARELPDSLLRALADARDPLAGALTDLAERLVGPLTDLAERLLGPLADLAERLVGASADVAECRARALADLGKRLAGALADVLDGVAGLVEQMACAASDLLERLPDALEQLRVAIERQQHTLEYLADVVEPRLEQRLRLDALDLQLDLAQVGLRADADVEQLPDLGEDGYARIEVIDLDVDLVHLDDRDVGQDVRALRPSPRPWGLPPSSRGTPRACASGCASCSRPLELPPGSCPSAPWSRNRFRRASTPSSLPTCCASPAGTARSGPEPDDDDRLRPPDPLFLDEDDPLFDFAEEDRPRLDDEPCEPPERLLLLLLLPDREFFVGIQSVLPGNLSDPAYPQRRDRILLKLG